MTRIILKLHDGGDAEKGYYTEKFYRKFKDLMSRGFFYNTIISFPLLFFFDKILVHLLRTLINNKHTNVGLFLDFPDIQTDQRRIDHIEALTVVLRDILGDDLLPKAEELVAIYGRVGISRLFSGAMNSV